MGILGMNFANSKTPNMAVLCLTEAGVRLAFKLAEHQEACLYIPERLKPVFLFGEEAGPPSRVRTIFFSRWQESFNEAFQNYAVLVCIMAAGIVVRSLAPLMQSKYTDPAVLVMDEKGQYIISLLSGHAGGANQLARELAGVVGGQAVITTASDVSGKPALDLLAAEMNAIIEPLSLIKRFNRCLVEGRPVYLYSPWPLQDKIRQGFQYEDWYGSFSRDLPLKMRYFPLEPAVIISPYYLPFPEEAEIIQLRPRNLALGIGCRRGVPAQEIKLAVNRVCTDYQLDIRCISSMASIDFKRAEQGMVELAQEWNLPLQGFSAEEIRTMDGSYKPSQQVLERIGVGGVCEPAALLAVNRGLTLVPKQKQGPVTVSLAMEKSWWWDWDLVHGI